MDYDMIRNASQQDRDYMLKTELGEVKTKIIEKYGLTCNSRLYWERIQDKYPTQEYFSHRFIRKASPIGVIFHIYRLCYAKVKYFEANWDYYEPYAFDCKKGLIKTELSDMEFMMQKATGFLIDLRELQRIKRIEDFRELCTYLENKTRDSQIT